MPLQKTRIKFKKTTRSFCLDEQVFEMLRQVSFEKRISMSELVNLGMRPYLVKLQYELQNPSEGEAISDDDDENGEYIVYNN